MGKANDRLPLSDMTYVHPKNKGMSPTLSELSEQRGTALHEGRHRGLEKLRKLNQGWRSVDNILDFLNEEEANRYYDFLLGSSDTIKNKAASWLGSGTDRRVNKLTYADVYDRVYRDPEYRWKLIDLQEKAQRALGEEQNWNYKRARYKETEDAVKFWEPFRKFLGSN